MKKIIALAVASAFVAPAVMAEAVIYGSLRPHVEYSDTGNVTKVELVDDVSRIGFKGSDKLDNGIKLFWQVENRIRIGTRGGSTTHTDGFTSRDSFVGLAGNFGEVSVGKISDLTDQFTETTSALDYWNGATSTYIFASRDTARLRNAALYVSPSIAGFQAKALYDFGNKTATANYQGYQGGLTYTHKLFKVGGAYKQNNDTTSEGDQNSTPITPVSGNYYKNYSLGATVTPVAGLDVSALWVRIKTRSGATTSRQDAWAVGAIYLTGKHGFGLSYSKMSDRVDNNSTIDQTGASFLSAQYKYSLSKQTTAIATAGYTRNDNLATFNVPGVAGVVAGSKIATVSAGLRTDF